nr:hypothetical protein [Brevundimonas diminuta]
MKRKGRLLTDTGREALAAVLVILLAVAFAGAALQAPGPAQPLPAQHRIR